MTKKSKSPVTLMFVSDIHLGSPLLNHDKIKDHFDSDADAVIGLPRFLTRIKNSDQVTQPLVL